ncbi:hypothetical protein J5N97_018854 [Dioscorea zingiberensis]|uniref:Uncharacterized protein n=1 Tax=Dioscorea zingiberensis TaxID=325984 RepID=A0A9D5CDM8_9LILI|nr:hypothetical protein J5N97_018854 [Dioscorea zingiberensis]
MGNPRRPSKKSDAGSEPDLHAAARAGDLRAVESICSSNPLAINSRDRHSRTPLHLAAWSGQAEVVSYLCKHKADVGAAAMDDTGAIHFAAQKGHLEVVRILLSFGVSVKAANRKGLTPLHYAAQGSHLELVRYLIKKGVNLTAKSKSGQTALDIAGNEEVRTYLVECEKTLKEGGKLDKGKAGELSKQSVEEKSMAIDMKDSGNKSGGDGEDGGKLDKGKADELSKQSVEEKSMAIDMKDSGNKSGDGEDGSKEKRKIEGVDDKNPTNPKRGKVSLDHLISENDDVVEE